MEEVETEFGFVNNGNAQVYYEQSGTGIPLIMIHAGMADSRHSACRIMMAYPLELEMESGIMSHTSLKYTEEVRMTINDDNQQEELEQKITEAELEAQIEEEEPVEDVTSPFESEMKESPEKPEKEKPSKARKIWRMFLVWMVVITVAFAGGFFFDTAFRYQPQVELVKVLKEDLSAANDQILSLEAEIERLGQFEDENISLTEQIDNITTHITLLSARAAVADATLAVEQDRTADAKLALDKVGSTLASLKGMLNADQAEVVENMIQRHNLIMIELQGDGYTVQTDLELLAGKLNTLEATLFASP
jgi:cell division protein FtsL